MSHQNVPRTGAGPISLARKHNKYNAGLTSNTLKD
jgi:hypothetical protein